MCALYLITLVTSSCYCLSDSGEHARTVSDLIKRSEYSLNQLLSCVDWVCTTIFTYLQRKKSRGVRSGDLVGRATDPHSISISPYRLCLDVLVLAY